MRRVLAVGSAAGLLAVALSVALAEIPHPDDAQKPLPPDQSAAKFKLPPGFKIDWVASEPLIHEPSGVCWDEKGRMFVSELHGYNLEGEYDIEALNKTGELDHVVRRIQADDKAKEAAKVGTYGTIKMLVDTDGDGKMDKAIVWADHLPPVYGICAARGGVIAACAPDIVYVADRDGDGKADFQEKLFTGFGTGALERGINDPQWGPDDWIYFGKGHDGGHITGPHLEKPVDLPNTDFRIKSDGSAIEPIPGGTKTLGMAFTAEGERLVMSTSTPGIHIGPLPWRYLARNPFLPAPPLENNGASGSKAYPISIPHPWRTQRANDPGFAKYYKDRYGIGESAASGYLTSACSNMIYQDDIIPELQGQILACEPAQNFVMRANVERQGMLLKLHRPKGEEQAEFLPSSDAWFHPISLSIGPDGAIWICDFYREIIEDYSAIPRYLQQEYGLIKGQDRGRIWRFALEKMPQAKPADMSHLSASELANEVGSKYIWRRQTARRLLVERKEQGVRPELTALLKGNTDPVVVISALSTLDALKLLKPEDVIVALGSTNPGIRVAALRLAEQWLDKDDKVWQAVVHCKTDEPQVRMQFALTLGDSQRPESLAELAKLAREHGDELWMNAAILSGLNGRSGKMLSELVKSPDSLGHAESMIEPLCTGISARRDPAELSTAIVEVTGLPATKLQTSCLRGFRAGFHGPQSVDASQAARDALKKLVSDATGETKKQVLGLIAVMNLETTAERKERLENAVKTLADPKAFPDAQNGAALEMAAEDDPAIIETLISAVSTSSPRARDAILTALIGRSENFPQILKAMEEKKLSPSAFSAVQRRSLLDSRNKEVKARAAKILEASSGPSPELVAKYAAALGNKRDIEAGGVVFKERCSPCHQAHGVGNAVGPDLTAEFGRAEETIIRDILAPSDVVSAGYWTYTALTTDGRVFTGLLANESATSITLLQPEGKQQVVLRKDIDELHALPISLMPDDLAKVVSPQDAANVIASIHQPTQNIVLIDENADILTALNEGKGGAEIESNDVSSGRMSLRITPFERYSPRIAGWKFPIREKPGQGEYRYIRFAWKSDGGDGLMIELANNGEWPSPQSAGRRYTAGKNKTGWKSTQVSPTVPSQWKEEVRDLWKDAGNFTLTGIGLSATDGPILFDHIELLQTPPTKK